MIQLIATVDSIEQAEALVQGGIDYLYIGEDTFGLRLPTSFSRLDQQKIVELAHAHGKKVIIAADALMHMHHIDKLSAYFDFLNKIQPDYIALGDTGAVYMLKNNYPTLDFIYSGGTLVTSSKQVNFWGKQGAAGAVLANEIPYEELKLVGAKSDYPAIITTYGAICIHQSLRPLLNNYFNFTNKEIPVNRKQDLFISEPDDPNSHYSIYEDINGTHIFANNDINLLPELGKLVQSNLTFWKLDGLFCETDSFVKIAKLFVQARQLLTEDNWNDEDSATLNRQLVALQPVNRGLDNGFFDLDPTEIR